MTMLSIGTKKGFSLYELMVAIAFLSFGLIAIYESFFITADAAKSMPYYLKTQILMDEKIWASENLLRQNGYLFPNIESGGTRVDDRDLIWEREITVLDHRQGLYKIEIGYMWHSGPKKIRNSRIVYVRK